MTFSVGFYRFASIILFISATISAAFGNTIGYICAVALLLMGFYVSRKYKCPICGQVFDIRRGQSFYRRCTNCGNEVDWNHNYRLFNGKR